MFVKSPNLKVISGPRFSHGYWWLRQTACRYMNTTLSYPACTHVPVQFANSTSLIPMAWLSKHHKSPRDWALSPFHFFFPFRFLCTPLPPSHHQPSMSSIPLSITLSFSPSLPFASLGSSRKFAVCCLSGALMDRLSSAGLKISPRAKPLLFPGCHAEDE